MAAVLHLAVLSARMPRHAHHRPLAILAWQAPAPTATVEVKTKSDAPSNPTQTYCVGQVRLTFGMAVIGLADRLQVMRTGSARGY